MIETPKEFQDTYNKAIAQAVDLALEKMLTELKSQIEKEVYWGNIDGIGMTTSPSQYKQTGGFYDSWLKDMTIIKNNIITSQIWQDCSIMILDQKTFEHGSLYPSPNDVREGMADIIFNGKAGSLFGDGYWREKRDAWSPTIDSLTNGIFASWVLNHMKSLGFDITLA